MAVRHKRRADFHRKAWSVWRWLAFVSLVGIFCLSSKESRQEVLNLLLLFLQQ